MKNLFQIAAKCLHDGDIDRKLQLTRHAWQLYQAGDLEFFSPQPPLAISATRFPARPVLCDPRRMPRRKLTSTAGMLAFYHAIAHIEFVAIYLAWDIIYRFRGMPQAFYLDWLRVADEEAQHFALLRGQLQNMGSDYGELSAHRGLWDVAEDTGTDLLARLALVPRFMEARGLDVTPGMIERFRQIGERQGVAILTRILQDEIGHVALGSRWFATVCRERGVDPEKHYRQLIARHFKGRQRGALNRELRKKAGFSDAELDWLEQEDYRSGKVSGQHGREQDL